MSSTGRHGMTSVHTQLSTSPVYLTRGTITRSSCGPLAQGKREGLDCSTHPALQGSSTPEEPGRHTEIHSSPIPTCAEGLALHQGHQALPVTKQINPVTNYNYTLAIDLSQFLCPFKKEVLLNGLKHISVQ